MSASAATTILAGDRLTQAVDALSCPTCRYSLRGLPVDGEMVTCPECGGRFDRAKLVTDAWTDPWTRSPGYSKLLWPTALAGIAPLLLLLIFAHEEFGEQWSGLGVIRTACMLRMGLPA